MIENQTSNSPSLVGMNAPLTSPASINTPIGLSSIEHMVSAQRWSIQRTPELLDGRLWQLLREVKTSVHNSKNGERKNGFNIYVYADTAGQKREMATDDGYY
jgi:hypothetical protein